MTRKLTRRRLLRTAGAGSLTLAAGSALAACGEAKDSDDQVVPFHGDHQAGIATPAQDRLHFAAFDVVAGSVADVRDLMRTWTDAAGRMTAGERAGPRNDLQSAPPDDTGEAVDLTTGRLTVTFGFGPTLFRQGDLDRFGLTARRPQALVELPAFAGDTLDPERSGGDLCVQACADDPQVAFHAVRNLARLGRGVVVMRWSQLGFGRTASTSRAQDTPRNLMGFKDGTNNIKLEDTEMLDRHVWVGATEQAAWLRRGYSFTDGIDERLGQLDAGLFFISFQRDPAAFVTVQDRLARNDALNEYITHTGSALFACPPGARRDGYVGEGLLG